MSGDALVDTAATAAISVAKYMITCPRLGGGLIRLAREEVKVIRSRFDRSFEQVDVEKFITLQMSVI